MKKNLFFIYLLLCIHVAIAQTDNAAKYAAIITGNELKKHLSVIAGEEFEGRETGTEGQRKAAAYIEYQFKMMGLKPVKSLKGYQQFYPLYKDTLADISLTINNKKAEFGKDFYSQLFANETGKFKGKKVIFIGYGIDDKNYSDYYINVDVKGKVVMFFAGEPKKGDKYIISSTAKASEWSVGINKKLLLATSKGAIGAIIVNPIQENFSQRLIDNNKKTNIYFPRKIDKKINHVFLSHDLAKSILGSNADTILKIAKVWQPIGDEWILVKNIKIEYKFEKRHSIINASNVIGIVEGSDKKDEYVFVTGHYDHLGKRDGKIYYGADDDGSGTVGVLLMAEAFAKAKAEGKGPRRTMVFMTVSGEEKGLWGSEYYSDHPFLPLEKTSVDLNIDMVGRIDTERKTADTLNYIYVVGHDKISSDLPVINEGMNNKYTQLVFDYKFDDPNDKNRIYFRSDHYNFARKGVPVLFFYDGMLLADYHQPTDTVDKINWDLYEKRVRMIFHTAWEIANRNEMLKRDIPLQETSR